MLWLLLLFLFRQKTAYELRISDWSSDVCSSDLAGSRSSLGKAEILRLPALLTDPRPISRAGRSDLALSVELARAFGEIVVGCFTGPAIDARAFAACLGCCPILGAKLVRCTVTPQRSLKFCLVAAGGGGECAALTSSRV